MNRLHTYIAKSAKPKLVLALLAMLALTAGGLTALAKSNALAISVSPASRSFTQGQAQTVTYVFTVSNSQGAPTLEATGIPSGVVATWSGGTAGTAAPPGQAKKCTGTCATVSGDGTATLTLRLPYDLAAGTFPISVTVTTPNNSTATTTATLASSAAPQFTITGNAQGPLTRLNGPAQPIILSVHNPYDHALTIKNVFVRVTATDKPGCGTTQFVIAQVAAAQTYTIPAGATQLLGDPKPTVSWPDDPAHPQNACMSAGLTFGYTADGTA
jgi:hypothetical protein